MRIARCGDQAHFEIDKFEEHLWSENVHGIVYVSFKLIQILKCVLPDRCGITRTSSCLGQMGEGTLGEEFRQTNVILQYKLLAAILSAVCIVIQQS